VPQESHNPKVFIATGTGLAPIYNMICCLPEESRKSLYFTVATETELFYTEELKNIENLDLHIHITKEKHEYHKHGRVDVDMITATPDTEWYLCGNPRMVTETTEKLAARGMVNVYSEEFN
jgi:NAD(P)H-flavin reductase